MSKCAICGTTAPTGSGWWAVAGGEKTICKGKCWKRHERNQNKRALVLSGGGTYGAFQVGALIGLTEAGYDWDLIVGTSAGALNGAFMSQAMPSKQRLRAYELLKFWRGFTSNQVYTSNVGHLLVDSICETFGIKREPKPAIYDTAPLRSTIASNMPKPPAIGFKVVATNLATSEARVVDASQVDDMVSWVLASASVPVLFPPVEIEGHLWVDGGVRRNDPLEEAIQAGAVEIDVVLCTPLTPQLRPLGKSPSLFQVAERALVDVREAFSDGDADEWRKSKVARVRVIAPTKLPDMTLLTFDHDKLEALIAHGQEVARAVLDAEVNERTGVSV